MCSLITAISFFLKLGRGLEPLGIHDNPISCSTPCRPRPMR